MAWWMIPALIAGGVAASAIGSSSQAKAEQQAADSRNNAINRFSNQQSGEFNRRLAEQRASRTRVSGLRDEGFSEMTGAQRGNMAERLAIARRYDDDETDARISTDSYANEVNTARNTLRDASYLELGAATEDERARQEGFQAEGNQVAAKMLADMGLGAFNAERGAATGRRQSLISYAMGSEDPAAAATPAGVGSRTAEEIAARVGERVGMARTGGMARAGVDAYGDAESLADRLLGRAGERTDILSRKSYDSRQALDPEVEAAQEVRRVADKDAETRVANAEKDLENYVTILQDAQNRESTRVGERQTALNQLMEQFYSGAIQTEEDFIAALQASSLNYEDALQALVNFEVNGTYGRSTFGQLMSGAGSALLSGAIGRI